METPREKETLQRILAINWRAAHHRQQMQPALFREYLRRTALWSESLGWNDAHSIVSDFPERILPNARATPVNSTLLQQTLRTTQRTTVYERMILTRALNWAVISHQPRVEAYHLPDLYEPLLRFFEFGGWLDKGEFHGEWLISGQTEQIGYALAYLHLPVYRSDTGSLQ